MPKQVFIFSQHRLPFLPTQRSSAILSGPLALKNSSSWPFPLFISKDAKRVELGPVNSSTMPSHLRRLECFLRASPQKMVTYSFVHKITTTTPPFVDQFNRAKPGRTASESGFVNTRRFTRKVTWADRQDVYSRSEEYRVNQRTHSYYLCPSVSCRNSRSFTQVDLLSTTSTKTLKTCTGFFSFLLKSMNINIWNSRNLVIHQAANFKRELRRPWPEMAENRFCSCVYS